LYYAGSALLPPLAGLLKDATGTATSTVLLSASMMFASLCLLALLRWEQVRKQSAPADARHDRLSSVCRDTKLREGHGQPFVWLSITRRQISPWPTPPGMCRSPQNLKADV
jgi:hypothetical protein